jgi:hypothetical protein
MINPFVCGWRQGKHLRSRPGLCTNIGVMQTMLCGTALNQRFASGGVSGHMYVWRGRLLEKVRPHSRGPFDAASSDHDPEQQQTIDSLSGLSSMTAMSFALCSCPRHISGPVGHYRGRL